MERREYRAGVAKFSFWVMEFKSAAKLLAEGRIFEEIRDAAENEKFFATSTLVRVSQVYNTVAARIKSL